jgi:hypothetical protein
MFDADTAALLRSAPDLPDLSADKLPLVLTQAYAELVTARLRGVETEDEAPQIRLAGLADTYELVTVLSEPEPARRASAFVAATAQQILSKRVRPPEGTQLLSRDEVHPSISATVLFLAAEQYPDANEAADSLPLRREGDDVSAERLLAESLRSLAKGNLRDVLQRAGRRMRLRRRGAFPAEGTSLLYGALLDGVELLAAELLAEEHPNIAGLNFTKSAEAFDRVRSVSSSTYDLFDGGPKLTTTYPGPAHLATLLRVAGETLAAASVQKLDPPAGADLGVWQRWLLHRAKTKPLLWPNHRTALEKKFHETGVSALITLPTGAGKTTVAEFKIAGVLARGKSVIFLVPTHALADQLRDDLADSFPPDVIGGEVSTDFDLFLRSLAPLASIEVMTPEMCLARLSLSPDTFEDVGLLVFDECHMLSPKAGSVRRAIDSMLCVLGFQKHVQDADLLFLSAMVRDGGEFTEWLAELTGRECVLVDPIWKPSRQARGVVLYEEATLRDIRTRAANIRRQAETKGVGKRAKEVLRALPYVLFGLQHNWALLSNQEIALCQLLATDVELDADVSENGDVFLRPNAPVVASAIAAASAQRSLKTIVFVSTAQQTLTNANRIAKILPVVETRADFEEQLWTAVHDELGDGATSLVPGWSSALPHSANLLPIERRFVETLYRRATGASVIVATTTLSQGMNLPAEVAILAGDKRADLTQGGREALKAHEILNAAGRAGRAGHLANGVVILVPEALLKFGEAGPTLAARQKLKAILPESDRCIDLEDPLMAVLDQIQEGTHSAEATYLINRLHGGTGETSRIDEIRARSLAAFHARKRGAEADFALAIKALKAEVDSAAEPGYDPALLQAASQSGFDPQLLQALLDRLRRTTDLPASVETWIDWLTLWFEEYPAAADLLGGTREKVRAALGLKATVNLRNHWPTLNRAMKAWIAGVPLAGIEGVLGGSIKKNSYCPQARELATELAPRGFSFALSLIAQLAKVVLAERGMDDASLPVLSYLATAIRRGYNTQALVSYALETKGPLTRVQFHRSFARHSN